MKIADFDFQLPPDLIAQEPTKRREQSRLMVLDRATGTIRHDVFAHIGNYLSPGDILVANRSKVIPARLAARRETGGLVELLLIRPEGENRWSALARPSRRLREGSRLALEGTDVTVLVEAAEGEGIWRLRLQGEGDVGRKAFAAGSLPLPPYIRSAPADPDRYQTVYADRDGSIAAPTAGLHFTPELFDELARRGVRRALVTLHVGIGTFRPVTVENIEDHRLHTEWGEVSAETAARINETRRAGAKTIAVGTTSTRLLESACVDGEIRPYTGDTDRFIYPGYRFHAVDALITNFHLPRSTLIMLVSAFAGRDIVLAAYREAVEQRYRFFSFGDAMLIL